VDHEDLKMKFIYSIAVARHTKHLGFTGVRMNPEHSNVPPFILLLSSLTAVLTNSSSLLAWS